MFRDDFWVPYLIDHTLLNEDSFYTLIGNCGILGFDTFSYRGYFFSSTRSKKKKTLVGARAQKMTTFTDFEKLLHSQFLKSAIKCWDP